MVKLKEIEAALKENDYVQADYLMKRWGSDRGIKGGFEPFVMRYIERLEEELDAYRKGGVTEEILRRNDGHIKLGKGCTIVREEERVTWTTEKPTREGWWWLQQDSEEPELVNVYSHIDDGLCVAGERRIGHTLDEFCTLMAEDHDIRWSSELITEPEEA